MPHIREMRSEEVSRVSSLVISSFTEFIAPGYPCEGVANFTAFAEPDRLAERARSGHFTLVAESDGELAGMIQVRVPAHVLMLFVAGRFHRSGIARALMRSAVERIRIEQPEITSITVNSTPYAVEAYRHMGFKDAGEEQVGGGIVFTPMVLPLTG